VKLGVVYPGATEDPTVWSSIPAGLVRGLKEAGAAEPLLLDPSPGPRAERALRLALAPLYPTDQLRHPGRSLLLAPMGPEFVALRSRMLARRLREAPALDALVIINNQCVPPPGVPFATYEDMTVPLALRCGYSLWRALPRRAVRARTRTQADLYRAAEACCAITRFAGASIERDYGVEAAKVKVIGAGCNHEPVVRERDWSRPRFLFVGREWERKQGDRVLAAFARVREQVPTARLDLAGVHPVVDAPGVTGHGQLTGDAVAALFAQATCFVMPSLVEPAGIVYAEAGAAGAPSIGTSVGGAPEMIGEGGLVVDPRDQEALERAMLELTDPELAQRLGAAASRHSKRFTWRATAERLLEALGRAGGATAR
jgi:glycosyltransferase involved in cell wall biosynthesis